MLLCAYIIVLVHKMTAISIQNKIIIIFNSKQLAAQTKTIFKCI